jgi:hypothetical protein
LVEQFVYTEKVRGSSPLSPTNIRHGCVASVSFCLCGDSGLESRRRGTCVLTGRRGGVANTLEHSDLVIRDQVLYLPPKKSNTSMLCIEVFDFVQEAENSARDIFVRRRCFSCGHELLGGLE